MCVIKYNIFHFQNEGVLWKIMLLNEVIEKNVIVFIVKFQATGTKDKVFHPSHIFTHDFDNR